MCNIFTCTCTCTGNGIQYCSSGKHVAHAKTILLIFQKPQTSASNMLREAFYHLYLQTVKVHLWTMCPTKCTHANPLKSRALDLPFILCVAMTENLLKTNVHRIVYGR